MEGTGQIIFYIILFTIIIAVNIVNANKKKQQKIEEAKRKQQQAMQTSGAERTPAFPSNQPKPKPFVAQPVEDPLTEFLKKAFQQNQPQPAHERPLEETVLEEVNIEAESLENIFDEVSASHAVTRKPNAKLNFLLENEDEFGKTMDFDPKKAVIYAEIMNRKY
ncbi:MAG: hypothetical protein A2W91_02200 [Bacteroidetes bacterium GWF2_38_335]|nr:MAG: hypothetical protein A2W91_02200 [Bacteroidetes bacterium GWF2_38_335]OFY80664.1 MAG: hypothetical protein A2281_05215 [Bacteroidetes bacterium RIFOXYA12_FULL_38_20]HBS87006.1 hypothetical protein [Bacteroidales bacterium]